MIVFAEIPPVTEQAGTSLETDASAVTMAFPPTVTPDVDVVLVGSISCSRFPIVTAFDHLLQR